MSATPISFTQIPFLNVFDLTRRSANAQLYKQGRVNHPRDLASEIVPDDKVHPEDLVRLEKEVNKYAAKKARA